MCDDQFQIGLVKKKGLTSGQGPLATPSQHHHSSSTYGISGISTIFPAVCSCRFSAVFAITCGTGILLCVTTGMSTFGTSMTFSTNLGRDSTLSCAVFRYPRSLQPGNLNIILVVQKELPQSSRGDSEKLSNERTLFFSVATKSACHEVLVENSVQQKQTHLVVILNYCRSTNNIHSELTPP